MYMQLVIVVLAVSCVSADFDLETITHLGDIAYEGIADNTETGLSKTPINASNYGDYLYGDIYHQDPKQILLTTDVFINSNTFNSYTYTVTSRTNEITKVVAINIGRQIGLVTLKSLSTNKTSSTLVLNILMNLGEQSRILITTIGKPLSGGSVNIKVSGLLLSLSSLLFVVRKFF